MMDERKSETGQERTARTVWVLSKDGHTMTCAISGEPGHEELRVFYDREVYLEERHTVHDGAVARACTLLHGFELHGWAPVEPHAASGTALA
jgi:hypothetical protein